MTTTLAENYTAHRALKGVGMKLVSLDPNFDGTITEILGYRISPAGRVEVTAIIDSPGAWYSCAYPVVLDADQVRLLLTVQSISPSSIHRAGKAHR